MIYGYKGRTLNEVKIKKHYEMGVIKIFERIFSLDLQEIPLKKRI